MKLSQEVLMKALHIPPCDDKHCLFEELLKDEDICDEVETQIIKIMHEELERTVIAERKRMRGYTPVAVNLDMQAITMAIFLSGAHFGYAACIQQQKVEKDIAELNKCTDR